MPATPDPAGIAASEGLVRGLLFFGGFLLLILAERWRPRRGRHHPLDRRRRWTTNLGLAVIDTLVLRLVLPAAAVGAALSFEAHGLGVFPMLGLPLWAAGVIGFLVLDLSIWAQHVAMHRVPLLWRLHRIHHLDTALDTTTALRFHPAEILLSAGWKILVILMLGIPAAAVLVFEAALSLAALFNHADLDLGRADRPLSRLIATPDWHRIHHSTVPTETNSNYAFLLTLWDRLSGTACLAPSAGHDTMTIGLQDEPDGQASLPALLTLPFRRKGSESSDRFA
ncbi:sterol desaturase family protein [Tistrella mobilis]|jgi:sterol desaturase/sphingolipid hydroxylase (fatty acid hydroxylase superfamily)|uniref:sterol desaturase family protein n=1 Tax=Tistrella mobilis TaxID=171437 RepID=UPI003557FA5C